MSDLQFDADDRNAAAKPSGLAGTIVLVLFGTPFAGFGLMALVQGFKKFSAGDTKSGLGLCLFGIIFSAVGFVLMFAGVWARKKSRQTAELAARFPDKPWMMRADWASGKIESKSGAPVVFFLFWSVLALALSAPAVWSIPTEWHKGNRAILFALVFPVAAICLIGYSFFLWRSQRRFGKCLLDLTRVPVLQGGVLEGMILVGTRLEFEHGLHLKFSCIRRVVTTSGKNRSVSENVLWQDEKIYKPEASLLEPEPGHTGVPVYFKLPDGQPQCFTRGNTSVYWKLEARAKMNGPDFVARFDVPVFHVAGAAVASVDNVDPTAALQMPIEEIRRDERSKIEVSDGPGGREYYFPPARNIGAAIVTSIFALAFDIGAGVMFHFHVPIVFPILFGLFGLLISCFAFSLWFKSSRVTIDSNGVRTVNRYLFFCRTRQFAASDVARFETTPGVTSGTQTFMDIRLTPQTNRLDPRFRTSDARGVAVATGIASVAEANWLAAEMNRALGRGN